MNPHQHAEITWRFFSFDALSATDLYELLRLRSEVFVVEQACIFQDIDGADLVAMHLLGWVDGQLMAYCRCFAADATFTQARIGRVVTRETWRGGGFGHVLMHEAIGRVQSCWGPQPLLIHAQSRLEKFYMQHGFTAVGLPYIEDGIEHIEMLRAAPQAL